MQKNYQPAKDIAPWISPKLTIPRQPSPTQTLDQYELYPPQQFITTSLSLFPPASLTHARHFFFFEIVSCQPQLSLLGAEITGALSCLALSEFTPPQLSFAWHSPYIELQGDVFAYLEYLALCSQGSSGLRCEAEAGWLFLPSVFHIMGKYN